MRRLALCQLVLVVAAGCSIVAPTTQPVTSLPVLGNADQPFGNADRALEKFDPTELVKRLQGGPACRASPGGNTGSDVAYHRDWILTCPRIGDDRTIYFLLSDAIDAELRRIATVPGRGGNLGNAQQPASTVWEIKGNAYVGSARALLVNGNGNMSIFINLDLLVP